MITEKANKYVNQPKRKEHGPLVVIAGITATDVSQ